ncbi:MAG: GAF domain-containing sensor histidine kinase [Pseudomonadota bacterium]
MTDSRIDRYYTATRRMLFGDFSVEIPLGHSDDIGHLGEALRELAQTLDRRFQEFKMLAHVTEEINAGLVLEEVLNRVFETFRPIIPYNRIGFALLEENDTIARARWARSDAAELRITKGFSAPMQGSSLQAIIDSSRPRILNDLKAYLLEHPQSTSTALIVAEGMQSSLTCPLIAMAKPIGFMFFSSTEPNTYRNAHVEIFTQIAGQLSVIVEKSRLYQQLMDLNDLKNRFLGMAAHDLRNPIGVVQGYAKLMADGVLGAITEKQRTALASVDGSCETMLGLINDFLDISAIESGKLTLDIKQVDLKSFLTSCHEANALLADGKNITLRLEMAPDQPSTILIDPDRMNQVLGNLIGNAIKYSYPGTTTILQTELVDGEVHFLVTDRGQGIPPEDIPKLFQDFGKASVRPTAGEKSTGLGLAICRRIVEAHKGRIWCESEVGKGSTFTVAIPVAA